MLRDIASRIRFDQKIEVALILVRGDWGVGANHFLGLAFNSGSNRDVLANWET